MMGYQSEDSGLFYKHTLLLLALSLKARPLEKCREKKAHSVLRLWFKAILNYQHFLCLVRLNR